ncbi:MAG: hypothetical protein WEC15_05395, partial [Flavobacteriales bacterium]
MKKRTAPWCRNGLLLPSLLALVLWSVSAVTWAQTGSNYRERWVFFSGDTLLVDTLSIVPGSLVFLVDSIAVEAEAFTLDPFSAEVHWPGAPDSALARYRVMPLLMAGVRSHKDPQRLISSSGDREDPFRYTPP